MGLWTQIILAAVGTFVILLLVFMLAISWGTGVGYLLFGP